MPSIIFVQTKKTPGEPSAFDPTGDAGSAEIVVQIEPGATILDAARQAKIDLETPCNAIGSCGKCKVQITHPEERNHIKKCGVHLLSEDEIAQGIVLACQTAVYEDITVLVKDYKDENKHLRILSEGGSFEYNKRPFITKEFQGHKTLVYGNGVLIGTEDGDTTGAVYGLAVDIGTTTIVAGLIDLKNGQTLILDSALNPQSAYAQDVLSRIHFAGKGDGLAILYRAFIETLRTMIANLTRTAGINGAHIYEAVYSGNTAMLHLACNVDPSSLGKYPYTPKITGGCEVAAEALGIAPFGVIYLPPVISAYVGADITSGILSSRLVDKKGVTLFIDIGTNGEMVLAKDGVLAASSTAAGPAFEGMNISCGMRASLGALESFSIEEDGSVSYQVISDSTGGDNAGNESNFVSGICGSGLLDLAGELVRCGVIDKSGRFVPPEKGAYPDTLKARMGKLEGKNTFFITDTVYLSQKDIRQIQLAKGAMRCGIEMLLTHFSLRPVDVDAVVIAGSFGYHLNEASLINISLLPAAFVGKVHFAGNTSLSGGIALLMNTAFRDEMKELVTQVDHVELSRDAQFEELFIKYMEL
jgi:uncharacterized 2Fe-2S/4Fe-4S cluster protein (DUF4445 family)